MGCRMNGFWETGCELSLYPKHYSSEGECFLAEIGSSGTVNGMREGFFSEENELEQSPRIHFQAYCRLLAFLSNKPSLVRALEES